MKNTLLYLFLFAITYSCYGKEGSTPDSPPPGQAPPTETQPASPLLQSDLVKTTYSRGRGSSVHFEQGIGLGYFTSSISAPGNSISGGGGFIFKIDLGLGIELPSATDRHMNILSITAFYSIFGASEKVKDALGNQQSQKVSLTTIGIPISYTRMGGGDGTGGFWQVGANLAHITKADNEGQTLTNHYNSFYFEPCISAGLSIPFELKKRREVIGGGKALVGPFLAYAVTNMSADSGVTMHGFSFGLKYEYVFM